MGRTYSRRSSCVPHWPRWTTGHLCPPWAGCTTSVTGGCACQVLRGLVTAVAGTALIAWAGHWGATIAGGVAVVALASWLVIYVRISAPINARLKGAAQRGEVPVDTRQLQQSWDSVIDARSGLQMLGILGLCIALITA